MLGVDPEFGTSILRLWVAAGSTALLVLLCVLALFQSQWRVGLGPARRAGVVLVSAVLGAAIAWTFAARPITGDYGAERRNFQLRAEELTARTLAPGSPLACLDALAGESVEAACEKTLFASPASVAAASSYVAAQLELLSSMAASAARSDANIDDLVLPLRRSLEADRFGFLAHMLAVRDGCTGQNCKALALLHDANRVRANLSAETFDRYLEHYVAQWGAPPDGAVAEAAPPNAAPARKPVNVDFPTSASIPPISIMNPEPSGPVLPGVAAAAAANPNPQAIAASTRHSRKQTANPPAPTAVQSASSGPAATQPIWPEPMPPPPPPPLSAAQAQAPPAATTTAVPLNLPSAPPAGATLPVR
jgi:hypothetical protein